MKIVHFSDLHFSHFVTHPIQFFSKTWIGNANLLLKRGRQLQATRLEPLLEILDQVKPDLCVVTGDFTTTSQPQEFIKATAFVQELKKSGLPVLALPGNHDHYTKKAHQKKIFYNYLANPPTQASPYCLKKDGFEICEFDDCTLVLLDLTEATPWFTDHGFFHKGVENKLRAALLKKPSQKPYVFTGHFPILKEDGSYHSALKHAQNLAALLSELGPSYYLHGHNHDFKIIPSLNNSFMQIDSGSLSDIKNGSFSVLDTKKRTVCSYIRTKDTFIKGSLYAGSLV